MSEQLTTDVLNSILDIYVKDTRHKESAKILYFLITRLEVDIDIDDYWYSQVLRLVYPRGEDAYFEMIDLIMDIHMRVIHKCGDSTCQHDNIQSNIPLSYDKFGYQCQF